MADLTGRGADRPRGPRSRDRGALASAADRRRPRADLALWCLLAACAGAPGPAPGPPLPAPVERWCDASAPAGGDGSAARPWRALPGEVPQGVALHVASGLYPGPVRLRAGSRLVGTGVVVLVGGAAAAAVILEDAALERVSVQGGEVGVLALGAVRLEEVHLSGQRAAALRAGPGARVTAARLEVVGTLPGVDGLAGEDAVLELRGARFSGGLRRAVALQGGAATLEGLRAEGPATLLHAVEARASLRDAAAAGGQGPAVFAAGGQLQVRQLTVAGHEYAVQASRTQVVLEGVTARGPRQAGVALRRTTGRIAALRVERAGEEGGLLLDEASTRLEGVAVRGAASWGVLVRLGSAELDRLRVEAIRGEAGGGPAVLGDGLVVRDAQVDGGVVEVGEVDGAGLLASAGASVRLQALRVAGSGGPGAAVERGAGLELGSLEVEGARGPALLATEGGHAAVGRLAAGEVDGLVWADCEAGARVTVAQVARGPAPLPSRCVRLGP